MATATLNVKNFVNVAKKLPKNISVLIKGDHGIGKSAIVKQIAEHFDLPLIDMRLGQLTEGDMLGLPFQENGVTRFMPPWWVKKACQEPVCIFLDELNRGTMEVMQAAFQLVLDRKMQDWTLHPDTRVFSAVNSGANYQVQEIDPALLDRFWTIDLRPTTDEWLQWAKQNKLASVVVEFIRQNDKWLDTPNGIEHGSVSPSRRSWSRLSTALKHCGLEESKNGSELLHVCIGFIGSEATQAFVDYAKNYEHEITVEDVFKNLVKKLDPNLKSENSDTLKFSIAAIGTDNDKNVYGAISKKLESLSIEKHNGLIEKIAEAVHKLNPKQRTPKIGATLTKYMSIIPGELSTLLWSKLIETNDEVDYELCQYCQKWCAQELLKTIGVETNNTGVGVGVVPT